CSSAAAGPRDTTVTAPPNRSTSRTASSTAHSSCGLIVNPDVFVSTARWSAVSVITPPTVGTRLTQTRISISLNSFLFDVSGLTECAARGKRKEFSPHPRAGGIEHGAVRGDRDRVLLAHVLHEQR